MLEYVLIGGSFAFAAAWQPGPLQAFLLSRITALGWRRTLPSALAPVISDGPIAVLILLVLNRLPAGMETYLQAAGGVALLYFAGAAFREWRRNKKQENQGKASAPRTLMQAVIVNILNPGPWLGWSLIMGPLALEAWQKSAGHAVVLIASFYITMSTCLILFILLLGTTSFLGPRGRHALHLVSAFALAGLGLYRLGSALW
ncbi:MAG: LysE family transporter [Gemmatimonadales bacterium]|nr:LysE family transporter [Gemmatimonadales bacterium]